MYRLSGLPWMMTPVTCSFNASLNKGSMSFGLRPFENHGMWFFAESILSTIIVIFNERRERDYACTREACTSLTTTQLASIQRGKRAESVCGDVVVVKRGGDVVGAGSGGSGVERGGGSAAGVARGGGGGVERGVGGGGCFWRDIVTPECVVASNGLYLIAPSSNAPSEQPLLSPTFAHHEPSTHY